MAAETESISAMQAPLLSHIQWRSRRASQKWLMCMDRRCNREWMITWSRGDGLNMHFWQQAAWNITKSSKISQWHNDNLLLFHVNFFMFRKVFCTQSCMLVEAFTLCMPKGSVEIWWRKEKKLYFLLNFFDRYHRVLHFCWMIIVRVCQHQYTWGHE